MMPIQLSRFGESAWLRAEWQTFECDACGYEVPVTEEIAKVFRNRSYAGKRNLCSSCAAEEWASRRERRFYVEYKSEGIQMPSNCDFCPEPTQCTGDCWRFGSLALKDSEPKTATSRQPVQMVFNLGR